MPIIFRCPSGHKLNVGDELAGRKARCPACGVKMVVPQDSSDPRQVARPAPGALDDEIGYGEASQSRLPPLASSNTPGGNRVYRPDRGKVQTVHMLAVALAAVACFNAGPAIFKHANLWQAPDWARLVLVVAVIQLVYVAWMASIPDWSTVWVGMLVFALVCAAHAVAMAVVMFTPLDTPLVLGLENVRHTAAGWCFAVLSLNGMLTYACGRVAAKWRRANEVARLRLALE